MRTGKIRGIITIYLTLTLTIIISLIVTTIEMARVNMAKSYSTRVLQTAMESTLCDYYLPLFEKYHIFGLDTGYGNSTQNISILEEEVKKGIDASFHPIDKDTGLEDHFRADRSYLICNPSLEELQVANMKFLTEEKGAYFRKQAIDYMKYRAVGEGLTNLLESVQALEKTEKANQKFEEKIQIEQEFLRIDQKILSLIELVDGIKIKENQIAIFNGKPYSEYHFIKQMIDFDPTMERVHVNHTTIFSALENKYVNYTERFNDLKYEAEDISFHYQAEYERAVKEREKVLQNLMEEREKKIQEGIKKQEKQGTKEDSKKLEQEIESKQVAEEMVDTSEIDERIKVLTNTPITIDSDVQKRLLFYCSMVDESIKYYTTKIRDMRGKAEKSLTLIEGIKQDRIKAKTNMEEFLRRLTSDREQLGEVLYKELSHSAEDMDRYTDPNEKGVGMIPNIEAMERALRTNIRVLKQAEMIDMPALSYQEEEQNIWKTSLDNLQSTLKQQVIEGLTFDYSGVTFSKERNHILKTAQDLLRHELLELVVRDVGDFSDARLNAEELPSFTQLGKEEYQSDVIKRILAMLEIEESEEIKTTGIGSYGTEAITQFANSMVEELLYQAYEKEHCTNYLSKLYQRGQVLAYEQEYLLYGNLEDKKNAAAQIERIILLRTLGNTVSVLSDSSKVKEASVFAASVVGFTGLPFLISVVKYVILFIWALEQALVETAAILLGKKVPLYSTKSDFVIEFHELVLITKKAVRKKAKEYQSRAGLQCLGYEEYLQISLLLGDKEKQYYRMMDLIQENLRYEYEDTFRLKNCLVSYQTQATIHMKEQFFSLPFAIDRKAQSIHGYQFLVRHAVTY